MTGEMSWTPTENVVRHVGSQIIPDMEFFAPPPPEIGEIISADSSLSRSKQANQGQERLKNCMLWASGGAVGGCIFAFVTELPVLICALISTVIFIGIGILTTQYFYQCSYVGELGIALHSLKGKRSGQPKTEIFLFKDGKNLFTQQTRNYYNGVYTGTTFNYWWTRLSGPEFRLKGSYRSQKGNPPADNLCHFAQAAEGRWSTHLLPVINEQLNQLGYIEFPIGKTLRVVRIGPGFMEFEEKSGTHKVEVADMKDIQLGGGVFQFKHKDSTWWSGKGKYSFGYAAIPNARLFLICLERLTGIHW
ncbi:hypothetical protein [Acaryochloris marina]|uniref:hypothetical protein n=1 Tax=Acaryochloris marina TaxID=155978 RepID=UPI001BB04E05|nr:hypothetical protein [Acaryochloris marina]QUY43755.1 hypothetical protein I1H34_06465 [Acaryochloris marina S15]